MTSYEAIRKANDRLGIKMIADKMSISPSLLYKWSEPPIYDGGKNTYMNPLDRLAQLYALTGELAPTAWLCEQANGFFVHNPPLNRQLPEMLIKVSQQILKEFSEMLDVIAQSMDNDQMIDAIEAKRIRQTWEELKRAAESFVTACEHGSYFNSARTNACDKAKAKGARQHQHKSR